MLKMISDYFKDSANASSIGMFTAFMGFAAAGAWIFADNLRLALMICIVGVTPSIIYLVNWFRHKVHQEVNMESVKLLAIVLFLIVLGIAILTGFSETDSKLGKFIGVFCIVLGLLGIVIHI